jgi:cell division protein FtsL
LSKVADIYWDESLWQKPQAKKRSARRRRPTPVAKPARRAAPFWIPALIVTSIFVMLCVSINSRAFSEVKDEADQNSRLAAQIQNLMDENLALQEEIHSIKSDPRVIEREAKRIGIDVRQEKVLVPSN